MNPYGNELYEVLSVQDIQKYMFLFTSFFFLFPVLRSPCELLNKGGQRIKNKQKCSWIKQLQTEHFHIEACLFILPSMYASVFVWKKGWGRRWLRSGQDICIQLLDQSHISLQTKLPASFWRPLSEGTFNKDSFYRHFYFCLILFFITEIPSLAS